MTLIKWSLFSLFLLSCSHQHHNEAQHHMHKISHEELIQRFDDPKRDEWQKPEVVLSLLGPIRGKKLVDIGAGSGYFTKYFIRQHAIVTAADIDQRFLDHLEKNFPKLTTSKIAFDDPRMESSTYDMAFTSNTYHHIEHRVEWLKKVLTGLKKGGSFVIVDFKKDAGAELGPPQRMRLAASQVVDELLAAGFSKVEVFNQELPYQYVILGRN